MAGWKGQKGPGFNSLSTSAAKAARVMESCGTAEAVPCYVLLHCGTAEAEPLKAS